MARWQSHLTYANVMSTLAVFIALGGVSWAAVTLPKGSVGSAQLKTGAVSEKKLSPAVRRQLARTGAAGPQGPKGDPGPSGSDALFQGAAAGGALTGTFPAPQIAPNAITGVEVKESTLEGVIIGRVSTQSHTDPDPQTGAAFTDLVTTEVGAASITLIVRCTHPTSTTYGVEWGFRRVGVGQSLIAFTVTGPSSALTSTTFATGGASPPILAPTASNTSNGVYTLSYTILGATGASISGRATVVTNRAAIGACIGSAEVSTLV